MLQKYNTMAKVNSIIRKTVSSLIIAGKYRLESFIDNGSYGKIYLGVNQTNEEKVAVKLEPTSAQISVLHIENKIYKHLTGTEGFPRTYWYGQESNYNMLVMDLLGPSVKTLLKKCSGKFSMKTVLMLSLQMIDRIENLHKKNFIHRDIKPENFLLGNGKYNATVFLVDFGLSKQYRDSNNNFKHIKMETKKGLIGSRCYCSMNTHLGFEQSRRDDLISLGYVIIFLLKGILPWQNIKAETLKLELNKIYILKKSISNDALCKGLPQEFADYLNYCANIQFEEAPDYSYLRQLFRNVFKKMNYKYSGLQYDWEVKEIEKRDSVLTPKQQIDRLLRPGSTYFNLNPYEVLQIEPDTTLEEAKKKYKRLSILVHPDKNQDDPERAQQAFEIINKAWKTLENEETRNKCLDVIEEAKARTDHMIGEKKKRQKKEGKDSQVEEDDPLAYRHAVYVMTMKLFADMERRRRELEIRDTEERKRKREQEIEEEEKAKMQKEWQKNFEESQQNRVNSWKAFQAGGSGATSSGTKDTKTKTKKFKGFKPPKHKAESR